MRGSCAIRLRRQCETSQRAAAASPTKLPPIRYVEISKQEDLEHLAAAAEVMSKRLPAIAGRGKRARQKGARVPAQQMAACLLFGFALCHAHAP
eukprot:2030266-Prymnesium_polylepis.1